MVREEGGGYVTVDDHGENHGPWWTEINSAADKGSEPSRPSRSHKRPRDGADECDLEPKAPKSETEEKAEGGVSD